MAYLILIQYEQALGCQVRILEFLSPFYICSSPLKALQFINIEFINIECMNFILIFVEYNSFKNITHNKEILSKLEKLYHDINNVDLWVGGLAEEHQKGELGQTFRK